MCVLLLCSPRLISLSLSPSRTLFPAEQFPVKDKDNPENIAESIRALAKSVREDEYELFGELPSRRFNASEIVRNRRN